MKTKVVTDSGSGLTQKQADALGIGLLPLQVLVDDQQYLDGVNLDTKLLYQMLEDGKMPTTSQPPLLLEEEMFENYKKDGITDLIVINLSNGLSSTNQTVQATAKRLGLNVHTLDIYTTLAIEQYLAIAARQLLDAGKDPEEIIRILENAVDKSAGYLIVDNLDHLAAGGRLTPLAAKLGGLLKIKPEEIIRILENAVDKSAGYLIVDNLDHLAAGGRLTPLAAKLGGLLKIKPVLKVSKETEGKVDSFDKVRTFHKALAKGAEQIQKGMEPGVEYEFFVLNGNDDAMAQKAKELLHEISPQTPVHTLDMFPVIASHTGLGSIGMQYIPKIEGADYDETRICD